MIDYLFCWWEVLLTKFAKSFAYMFDPYRVFVCIKLCSLVIFIPLRNPNFFEILHNIFPSKALVFKIMGLSQLNEVRPKDLLSHSTRPSVDRALIECSWVPPRERLFDRDPISVDQNTWMVFSPLTWTPKNPNFSTPFDSNFINLTSYYPNTAKTTFHTSPKSSP